MNLTEGEKGYLAGLFDGEGTIGYYYKTALKYHVMQCAISNSSPEIMDWLKNKIPFGSIAITNNKKCKYINWSWICNSKLQVIEFLTTIRPYLIFKLKQVDLLLSLWNAEKEIGCKSGVKLSKETIEFRNSISKQLKSLKTSSYESIH